MTATPTPKPRRPRRVLTLSIVGAVVLALGAVAAGYAVGLGEAGNAAEAAGPGASGSGATSARPAPEASEPVVQQPEPSAEPVSIVPADCSGIYSTDWSTQMSGLVLNPAWRQASGDPQIPSTADDELNATLQASDPLYCLWASDEGPSHLFLVTNVAALPAEQPAATLARMQALNYSCYEELGGTRCILEENDDDGTWGESHFLRDGVWVATRWMNVAPDGYTHDIVDTLWP